MASPKPERPVAVYAAIAANLVIAAAKFVAAGFTGSASMLSEAIHSVVDTANEGLLILGDRRSRKPPDETFPFGYGHEIYFWGLMVAMLLFSLGGGVSIYEGLAHIRRPEPIEAPLWNYAVLAVALISEGISWVIATRKLLEGRKPGQGVFRTFQGSKDPAVFVVVAEDTAALLGIVLALAGTTLSLLLRRPWIDGAASISIGVLLLGIASVLVYETRALIMGEVADPDMVRRIREIAAADPRVASVRSALTMQLGPDQVLLNMDLRFEPERSADELFAAIDSIERAIRTEFPPVRRIFIEVENLRPETGRPQNA
jgi:cation diffusion facilitator family transporter